MMFAGAALLATASLAMAVHVPSFRQTVRKTCRQQMKVCRTTLAYWEEQRYVLPNGRLINCVIRHSLSGGIADEPYCSVIALGSVLPPSCSQGLLPLQPSQ